MMKDNPFIFNACDYTRNYNVIRKYIEDTSFYISRSTDKPIEEVREWVSNKLKDESLNTCDPVVNHFKRDKNGDKEMSKTSFFDLLRYVSERNLLMSPSMTTYLNPKEKTSMMSDYVEQNMALRNMDKKEGQEAEMRGDHELATFKNNLQTTRKIKNNAVSGAHGSPGTALYNLSAHPSLTSTCRCATSYANANNERFLMGMRHYRTPSIAINDITSIVNNSDNALIEKAIKHYDIVYPSVDNIMDMIVESTRYTWHSESRIARIRTFVECLTPLERAIYLYTQDCYSLRKLNPTLIDNMILNFSKGSDVSVENPDTYLDGLDADLVMMISILGAGHLAGRTLSTCKKEDSISYSKIGSIAKNVKEQLSKYELLIHAFWRTRHLPISIATYPEAIRKSVVVSDTDSTIFTVANWVKSTLGELRFDELAKSIASVMVYFASQTLVHVLAMYSRSMGIGDDRLYQLEMKNEYMIESLILTGKGKHYAYRIIAKEGNVYKKPKLDVKGVTLRNSKVPSDIMNGVKILLNDIMDDVRDRQSISLTPYLKRIGDIERRIIDSVKHGSPDFLTREQIKPKSSYALPESSKYFYHTFWEAVFADKYGHITEVPCSTVKLPMDLPNRTSITKWISSINDVSIRQKLESFFIQYKRTSLIMVLVPSNIAVTGIPEELIQGSNMRSTVYSTMEAFYLLMESLGYYIKNDNNTRLISDVF